MMPDTRRARATAGAFSLTIAVVLASAVAAPGCKTGATNPGNNTNNTNNTNNSNNNNAPDGGPCTSQCGNGIVECFETCDDGNTVNGDGCNDNCRTERCGDGTVDANEQCDDGNRLSGDGCHADCTTETGTGTCGDGNVDYGLGEQCDDGNTSASDGCGATCQIEAPPNCGDGTLDLAAGEECDDGNTAAADGCSATCQIEPFGTTCGDGTTDNLEVCDDGGLVNGDACNPTCNLTNTTTPFVGQPGSQGTQSASALAGVSVQIGGFGVLAADDDYLYYADGNNRHIRRIEIDTGLTEVIAGDPAGTQGYLDDPNGLQARFDWVESITTDGITLWVASGRRIRAVDLTSLTFAVTTVAGNGSPGHVDGVGTTAQFDDLRGLTYYDGQVYFADAAAATVRALELSTATVSTLAGLAYVTGINDGFGAAARFQSPRYLASDNSGMLYIADTQGGAIRAYNTVTTEVTTFVGDGTAGYVDQVGSAARLHRPRAMTSDGTSVYWSEFNQHTVRQAILATRSVTTLVGTHCGGGGNCLGSYAEGVGTAARFDEPVGLAYHWRTGSLFVVDSANYVIRRIQ